MTYFHDAHSHQFHAQAGGLIIALEGVPVFPGVPVNSEVLAMEDRSRLRFAVPYVSAANPDVQHDLLKYHPRREGYSVEFVVQSIGRLRPKLCIIDTLNQPYWQPLDFFGIARRFPDVQFIYCHAGGYDIVEFVKMADFLRNVWLDFSYTQEYFGWVGPRPRLPLVCDCIEFCLRFDRIKRKVMFGSDEPFFSQAIALEKYLDLPDRDLFLRDNYVALLERAGLA